jgi:hypothetical protein
LYFELFKDFSTSCLLPIPSLGAVSSTERLFRKFDSVGLGTFDPSVTAVDFEVFDRLRLTVWPSDFEAIEPIGLAESDVEHSLVGSIESVSDARCADPMLLASCCAEDSSGGIAFGARTDEFDLHEVVCALGRVCEQSGGSVQVGHGKIDPAVPIEIQGRQRSSNVVGIEVLAWARGA